MTVLDTPMGAIGRLSLPRLLVVLGGFTVLTVIFFWPWVAHLSTALIGPPEDNMQDFWNSAHAAGARSWRDFVFTRQMRFPEGTSLTYAGFAWPQVFAVALLSKIFGAEFSTLVALHNITLLASFPLGAAAMFYLARHLLGDVPGRDIGAAVAGFIFAFNPWHVAQAMHHAHVTGIEFLPLFVLFYLKALEQRSWRLLFAAAAMAALGALNCWYYFFYAFYFLAFHLLYLRVHNAKWPRGWALIAPALCMAGATALLLPWFVPMVITGLKNPVYYVGSNMFVADLAAFIAFPPTHLLARYGSGIYAALTGNVWESTVYLGLVNLGALAWVLTRKGSKALQNYALGGMIFFAVIAGGEALHVAGHVTPLHLPGVILAKLPFFANVRTPARAMVMVYLFLGLALAQATVMALRYRKPATRAALGIALVLMLLDFTPTNLAATPATCSAGLNVIANDTSHFGVLDLPRGYGEGNAAMTQSVCHGKPIVQGETARHLVDTLADRLVTRDLAAQQRQLTAAQVKYIVLHHPPARASAPGEEGELHRWNKADGNMADYARHYTPVHQDKDMTVLRVY